MRINIFSNKKIFNYLQLCDRYNAETEYLVNIIKEAQRGRVKENKGMRGRMQRKEEEREK